MRHFRAAFVPSLLLLAVVAPSGACGDATAPEAPPGVAVRRARSLASVEPAWQARLSSSNITKWDTGYTGRLAAGDARLPRAASGTIALGPEHASLRLTPQGAKDVPLELAEGLVVAADAYPETDSVTAVAEEHLESFFVVRSPLGPHELRWTVEQPEGARAPRAEGGGLAFVDAFGETAFVVAAPRLVDARGERRDAALAFSEGTLRVSWDDAGLSYPLLVDPDFATGKPAWTMVHRPLPSSNDTKLAPLGRRGLLALGCSFGGGACTTTQVLEDGVWSPPITSTDPSPFGGRFYLPLGTDRALAFSFGSNTLPRTLVWKRTGPTTSALEATTGDAPTSTLQSYVGSHAYAGEAAAPVVFFSDQPSQKPGIFVAYSLSQALVWSKESIGLNGGIAGAVPCRDKVLLFARGQKLPSGKVPIESFLWSPGSLAPQGEPFAEPLLPLAALDPCIVLAQAGSSTWKGWDEATAAFVPHDPPDTVPGAVWFGGGAAWVESSFQSSVRLGSDGPGLPRQRYVSWRAQSGSHLLADAKGLRPSSPGVRLVSTGSWEKVPEVTVDKAIYLSPGWLVKNDACSTNQHIQIIAFGDAATKQSNGPVCHSGGSPTTTTFLPSSKGLLTRTVLGVSPNQTSKLRRTASLDQNAGWTDVEASLPPTADVIDAAGTLYAVFPPVVVGQPAKPPALHRLVGATWTLEADVPAPTGKLAWSGRHVVIWTKDAFSYFAGGKWQTLPLPPFAKGATEVIEAQGVFYAFSQEGEIARLQGALECSTASQCTTGLCVEGVCCDTACDGDCVSCRAPNTGLPEGVCGNILNGLDPKDKCLVVGDPACRTTGACDGSGKCSETIGLPCGPGKCVSKAEIEAAKVCDANRACSDVPGSPKTKCGNHLACASNNCLTSCEGDADCVDGYRCDPSVGQCVEGKALGSVCTKAADCGAGSQCVAGICCNKACDGICEACVLARTGLPDGTCAPVKANSDPLNQCAPEMGVACGRTGECDGKGACAVAAVGTSCGSTASCLDGIAYGSICDGQGACGESATGTKCAPTKVCAADAKSCGTTCTGDAQCDSLYFCDLATKACTIKRAPGASCKKTGECGSGFCVDGICCDSACTGQCEACAQKGSEGICSAVKGVPVAPRESCAGKDACAGTCNGVKRDLCTYAGATTTCASSCANDVSTPSTCDGAGECKAGAGVACAPYACDATTKACKKQCTSSTDCTNGAQCDAAKGICGQANAVCADAFSVRSASGLVTSCNGFRCLAGVCAATCDGPTGCATGFACVGGKCAAGGSAGANGSAGSGNAGSAGKAGSGAGGGGKAGAGGNAPPGAAPGDEGGCGCRTAGGSSPTPSALALAALAVVSLARRRRR